MSKRKKATKIILKLLFIILLVMVASGLLYIGLFLNKVSKKQYVFGVMIDKVFDKTSRIFKDDEKYIVGDNFSVSGTIDLNLSSEEFQNKSLIDVEYLKKNNLLKNLTLMDINYSVVQNKDKGIAYASLDEKIGDRTILSGKYMISDSTRYFFVQGVLKNYVNDGGSPYFESLIDSNTTKENIDYLYFFIANSIKKSIKEDDLGGYDTETNIGNNKAKVSQISLKVVDSTIKDILNNVLNDLKKDDRSSKILGGIYKDFSKVKLDKNIKNLNSNESYTINIYTKKIINKPLKYEIVYLKDDQKEVYSYEGDEDNGEFYYTLNNEIKYTAVYKSTNKDIDINVENRNGNNIGSIKVQKDSNNLIFTMTLDLDNNKYDIAYSKKYSNIVDKKSYDREDNLSFKIMSNMVNRINGSIKINSKVSNSAKIDEDISDAVLRSTLTENENNIIVNLKDIVKNALEK